MKFLVSSGGCRVRDCKRNYTRNIERNWEYFQSMKKLCPKKRQAKQTFETRTGVINV